MPPRKSAVSQISATSPDASTPLKEREGTNIEDLSLPRTMVQRLAKGVLPPNTSLHKDAMLALSKGATVFINYLAVGASTSTTNQNKRTIPPPAILEALVDLEYENFGARVEAELLKFNDVQVGKRNEYRRKVKEGKSEEGDEEGGGRARKRVRRSGGGEGVGEGGDGHEQLVGGEERGGEKGEEGGEGEGGEEEGEGDVEGDGDGDEGEEDDDNDEDEYPDEGRRLSSMEREAYERGGERSPGSDEEGSGGSSADEEGLSDVSD